MNIEVFISDFFQAIAAGYFLVGLIKLIFFNDEN